jgi:hypothetical protein
MGSPAARQKPKAAMKKRRANKSPRIKTVPPSPFREALERCRHITTLAGLLEQCGQVSLAEPMEPRLLANAGDMIGAESRAVETFLQDLELRRHV